MYRTPFNTSGQNREEINTNNQRLFSAILNGSVNSTPYQGTNVPISNTSYNNNNNNNNNKNNIIILVKVYKNIISN